MMRRTRAALKSLHLDLAGVSATAMVELTLGQRAAAARAVGRNVEERRLFLIAEATARALTDLLPPGYGVVIHDVAALRENLPDHPHGVLSSVLFLSPDSEQLLFGVAAGSDPILAAAQSALSAVNRRLEPLLTESR